MDRYHLDDTIVGVATPRGGSVRGILRLSGPNLFRCLEACFDREELSSLSGPRLLPAAMTLPPPLGLLAGELYVWPTSRSYTRQPSAEFHTIGSTPLLDAALTVLCQHDARLAEPGEFTLRAFLAGRIDLTQAEAVLGVIDSSGTTQLGAALDQLAGGLSGPLHDIRTQLLELLAHLEAGLDFVEEDIEFISPLELEIQLSSACAKIAAIEDQLSGRGRVQNRARVVLVGAANVGKSSLFNVIARDAAAIVSDLAGTTRDYLTVVADLDGLSVELVDTAGLETAASGPLENAAQAVARRQHEDAELQVLCLDVTRPLSLWEQDLLNAPGERLVVHTKCDLVRGDDSEFLAEACRTSARSGAGITELRRQIRAKLALPEGSGPAPVSSTAIRCRESLHRAGNCLRAARQLSAERMGEEIVAIELRQALDELGKVVGAVYTDDILDHIFSQFCIGK